MLDNSQGPFALTSLCVGITEDGTIITVRVGNKQNDLQLDYQNRGPQTYLCSVHAYSSNKAEDHFVC